MNHLFKRFLLFLSPFIIAILCIIHLDIHKVFYSYDDYYRDKIVYINREMICTKTYLRNRETIKYNSFIFGSSRSLAFKCDEWKKYLKEDANPFHYDASGDGVFGVANKMRFIDEQGDSIKNALIIIDRDFLTGTTNKSGEKISPPCLSQESNILYYWSYLKPSLDLNFLFVYLDYYNFGTYRNYMVPYFSDPRKNDPMELNKLNCDVTWGLEQKIKMDSITYYQKGIRDKIFKKRPFLKKEKCPVSNLEVQQLLAIKKILKRHHSNYKIVISPIYDQVPMEKEQVNLLNAIFGKQYIYNFSGINTFTNSLGNYYEESHYRPHVANEILTLIYGESKTEN